MKSTPRPSEKYLLKIAAFLLTLISGLNASPAVAQSEFAPGESFREEVVLRGLPISTAIAFAPGNRAYLALKVGIVRVVRDGALLPTPFIDLSAEVDKVTDRGLLGLAVDPDFPQKPFIYVSYVYDPPGSIPDSSDPRVIRVARLTADAASDYNQVIPGSMEVIIGKNSTAENMAPPVPAGDPNIPERASCMTGLTVDGSPIDDCIACDSTSHTAGTLIFGKNRQLFASFGDGADYNGPTRVGLRTQDIDSLSGRVLRIDVDTGAGISDNPWFYPAKPNSNRSRTWAYGFRNPFRITLRPTTQDVYIGDVGTSYYEEINVGKGMNFGWPCYEGGFLDRAQIEGEATASVEQVGYRVHPRTIDACQAMYALGQSYVRKPLFTYRHPYDATGKDLGSSITGLAFYEGTDYPSRFQGSLFFADYAQKFIRYLTFDPNGHPTMHEFAKEVGSNLGAVELLSGPDKNLYAVYIDLKSRTSEVRRFRPLNDSNTPPVLKASLSPDYGAIPLVVTAIASGSYDPDGQGLSYAWDFGDGSTATDPDAMHVYTTSGTYTVKITATETTAPFASTSDTFTVRSGQQKPIAKILTPSSDTRFEIGTPIRFSGKDATDSTPAASLHWAVLQIHNQHTHLITEIDGAEGTFTPTEHTDNMAYELCLEVSKGDGLSDQQCLRLDPFTTYITMASDPPGATITYLDEELDVVAPYVAHPIVGSTQSIRASLIHAGRSFSRWTDGDSSPIKNFTTTSQPRTFTAIYVNRSPKASISTTGVINDTRRKRVLVLDASSSSDPEGEKLTYQWRFSDRSRFNGETIRKSFRRPGRYSVTLIVTDPLGATSLTKRRITVSSRRGTILLPV